MLLRMRGNTIGGIRLRYPATKHQCKKNRQPNRACAHEKVGVTAGNLNLYNFATESEIAIILVRGFLEWPEESN